MTPRCFTQTFCVVGAILEQDGKVLLVKEGMGRDAGKWSHPAGWLDVGEEPIRGAKREVEEEAGVEFEPTGLIGIYSLWRKDLAPKSEGHTPHGIKLIFCGRVGTKDFPVDPQEIAERRWFTPQEIEAMGPETLRDIDIKQAVRDYFAGKIFPLDIIHHAVSE